MKNFALLMLALFGVPLFSAHDFEIGEEVIEPVHYPKFSLTGEYELNRKFHGFADASLRKNLDRRFAGTLMFEAGLTKYFNAGALFGMAIDSFARPMHFRFGLFGKPYIPLGSRVALFSRVSGGLSVEVAIAPTAKEFYGSLDDEGNFDRVYKKQEYRGLPFGGFAAATIGIEAFPFSRVGLAVEWGIRATLLYGQKNIPFATKVANIAGAPTSFSYLLYELPIMATVHIII